MSPVTKLFTIFVIFTVLSTTLFTFANGFHGLDLALDVYFEQAGLRVYVPLGTSFVMSLGLSFVLWIFQKF
ncbi:MAG TPA: DUF2905 family protein [Sphingomonadales bacterium]|nr:DUF2905 family protein [Sphingomonadales bacterium]